MKRFLEFVLGLIVVLGVLSTAPRCARIVAPTGGPQDTVPPRILRTTPPDSGTNFTGKNIRFYLNEYAKIDNPNANVFFSPPLKYPVQTLIKGKSVEINFQDTLRPNTTYTIQFGNSLADLTEANPIPNYTFVFSTGDSLDRAELTGHIRDALTHAPLEAASVFLYREDIDSLPLTTKPDYVTRADNAGNFRFVNIPRGQFKIFALQSKNHALILTDFSQPIAFSNQLVESHYPCEGDSVSPPNALILNSFVRKIKKQFLTDRQRPAPERLVFVFSRAPEGPVTPELLGHEGVRLTREESHGGDTVSFWIRDTSVAALDSLSVRLAYLRTDSTGTLSPHVDTLALEYAFKPPKDEVKTSKGNSTTPLKTKPLGCSFKLASKEETLPTDTVRIELARIPERIDLTRLQLMRLDDSTKVAYQFDSVEARPRDFILRADWQHGKRYKLLALPGAFTQINGRTNDTTRITIHGVLPNLFSTLHIRLRNAPSHAVLQVLAEQETDKVMRQAPAGEDIVTLPYLKPGAVWIRVLIDRNENLRWDPGHYQEGTEPEEVRYYKTDRGQREVQVRANWEYDLEIDYEKMEK